MSTELVLSIISGDDDAVNVGSTWPGTAGFDSTIAYKALGMEDPPDWKMCAYRFQNVTIPPGATIESAVLNWRSGGDATNYVEWWVAGEKTANPSVFSVDHQPTTAYNNSTTAKVSWIVDGENEPWVQGNWYSSPDIKTVIQEIIDQEGWASGNALVLPIWHDILGGTVSFRYAEFYEDTPAGTWSPTLTITYAAAVKLSNVMIGNVMLGA